MRHTRDDGKGIAHEAGPGTSLGFAAGHDLASWAPGIRYSVSVTRSSSGTPWTPSLGSERSATVQTDGEMLLDRNQQRTPAMKTIASAIAATMLLIGPISAPTPAFAGFAAGNLGEAVPRAENSAIQDVRNHRRGVRHERRMRQERRVRHERRPVRRCIRQGYCPVVYVLVPVYYYVPVWYSHPIYYFY
jgi:hypothetical protein